MSEAFRKMRLHHQALHETKISHNEKISHSLIMTKLVANVSRQSEEAFYVFIWEEQNSIWYFIEF